MVRAHDGRRMVLELDLGPMKYPLLHCGDCMERLLLEEPNSAHSFVVDPPYNLEFMGTGWDSFRGEPIDPAFMHWMAGFIDGEGCFHVHKKNVNGVETYDCQFSITLRDDDRPILERIQRTLKMGSLNDRPARGAANGQARYCVSRKVDCAKLRDLLLAFPLRAKKATDLELWSQAIDQWIDHRPGEWSEIKKTREMLMSNRQYKETGVRVDPFQLWTARWARQAFRVLRPGGYLVAFGSTRTYHRLAAGIEDAGFEIRDQLGWLYGQGFPKSKNIGGRGTALKPAWEPIVLARKPLDGNVEACFAKWGTGMLEIDRCRIKFQDEADEAEAKAKNRHEDLGSGSRQSHGIYGEEKRDRKNYEASGRWPTNLCHDGSDEALSVFPESKSLGHAPARDGGKGNLFKAAAGTGGHHARKGLQERDFGSGSTARLFYCAKASAADRDAGLEFEKLTAVARSNGAQSALGDDESYTGGSTDIGLNKVQMRANHHPTVKPTALMRWLVRLVTPPGGRCVDPMMGSGSTGRACALEDLDFLGIEREPEYFALAKRRIDEAQGELFAKRD